MDRWGLYDRTGQVWQFLAEDWHASLMHFQKIRPCSCPAPAGGQRVLGLRYQNDRRFDL
jgi:formylglycine-generating enzyme required for sulfatase activity